MISGMIDRVMDITKPLTAFYNNPRLQRLRKSGIETTMSLLRVWAVYAIVALSAGFVYITNDDFRFFPYSYFTPGWMLALFFPLVAVCFIIFSIQVRFSEIKERFSINRLWHVYFPGLSDEAAEYHFTRFLWKRVDEYYDLREYVVFSLLAGATTFMLYLLIAIQFGIPASPISNPFPTWKLEGPIWATLAGSGYLGSAAGASVFVLRRYRMYDLRPMIFLQVAVALIAGTSAGAFITTLYPTESLGFISFAVGFLSAVNIDFLPNLMRSQFARRTGMPLPDDIPSDLPEVVRNTEVIESLNRLSIYSVSELANSNLVRLYLNMPQQIDMINNMVDQSILHFYFGSMVKELEHVNIQRFTHLLLAMGARFSENAVIWPEQASLIDNGGEKDKAALKAAKVIIESGTHHRTLGLLLKGYRDAFF